MSKNLEISLLLDFYGEMLNEKHRDIIEDYYNADLSLAEIAEDKGITRQGVRDNIKRAELQLLELEDKLKLQKKFGVVQEKLAHIIDYADKIKNDKINVEIYASEIISLAKELIE